MKSLNSELAGNQRRFFFFMNTIAEKIHPGFTYVSRTYKDVDSVNHIKMIECLEKIGVDEKDNDNRDVE